MTDYTDDELSLMHLDGNARALYDALDQVDFLLWMIRGIRSGSTEPADSSPITVSDRHCRERQS